MDLFEEDKDEIEDEVRFEGGVRFRG